jgi:hypothetical protein
MITFKVFEPALNARASIALGLWGRVTASAFFGWIPAQNPEVL